MSSDSADSSDWFEKDVDEIVSDLKKHSTFIGPTDNIEYITGIEECYQNDVLQDSADKSAKSPVSTMRLRETAQMEPLDAFLSAMVYDGFFDIQLKSNDCREKVLLFVQILAKMCRLEIPGFLPDIINAFATNESLHTNLCTLITSLFLQKYKSNWTKIAQVDEFLSNIDYILLVTFKLHLINSKIRNLLQHIEVCISRNDVPQIYSRNGSLELEKNVHEMLNHVESDQEQSEDILPTLEELKNESHRPATQPVDQVHEENSLQKKCLSFDEYLKIQKYLLREDFIIPLRQSVHELRKNQNQSILKIFHDVKIVLAKNLIDVQNSGTFLVDLLGSNRKENQAKLPKFKEDFLKFGTLLCLTTNFEFDNLILAVMKSTKKEIINKGYFCIEILKQYNIAKTYDTNFIMFESPAFFEPYNNVFQVLNSCSIWPFPMMKYIVSCEENKNNPAYLKDDTSYTYMGERFQPLTSLPENYPKNVQKQLTSVQLKAYQEALKNEFCLIQGPPGTGKTHTSSKIVATLIENTKSPVVLITYTNDSLDKFLLKLAGETEDIVRFGNQSTEQAVNEFNIKRLTTLQSIYPNLKQLHYHTKMLYKTKFTFLQKLLEEYDGTDSFYNKIVSAQNELRNISTKLRSIKAMFYYYDVKDKGVIAMTSTFAAKTNLLFKLLKSPIVIFEEAAEILESHIVACLTPYTQHVILVGDHMQLQPYTSTYEHSRSNHMDISLFERMINRNAIVTVLDVQFRMRKEIADLIRPHIYENLQDSCLVTCYPSVRGLKADLYFLTHSNEESVDLNEDSKFNTFEVEKVCELAKYLILNQHYQVSDIVILSPYKKQIEKLSAKICKKPYIALQNIKVSTIDSFQGMEANIVLLTLVRSNKLNQIGFLAHKNRICVSLSRAKYGLYIVGNMELLAECSTIWRTIKYKLEARDSIGTSFPLC